MTRAEILIDVIHSTSIGIRYRKIGGAVRVSYFNKDDTASVGPGGYLRAFDTAAGHYVSINPARIIRVEQGRRFG